MSTYDEEYYDGDEECYLGVGGSGDGKVLPKTQVPDVKDNETVVICNPSVTLAEVYRREGNKLIFIKEVEPGYQFVGGPMDGAIHAKENFEHVEDGAGIVIPAANESFAIYIRKANRLVFDGYAPQSEFSLDPPFGKNLDNSENSPS